VRNTLEPRAARLAAERATPADREAVDALLDELELVHDGRTSER
jgi:DNA-binding FadR family transcriptional regulator